MFDSSRFEPYRLDMPGERRLPFVFNSPHSGRQYPSEFVKSSRLSRQSLRRSEDFLVDELFRCAVKLGAPMISARFARAWLDVNREPYELDPAMFDGDLPDFANSQTARVRGGLGTIARIVSETEEIYRSKLPVSEALARIEQVYMPYHAALGTLLAGAVETHGYAILVDCHSMPSTNEAAKGFIARVRRSDFVLGDRFGCSCSPAITAEAAAILRDMGYRVSINKPYAGGFNTEHYGRPEIGLHAIQIEVNRALYMDEHRIEKSAGFDALTGNIADFVGRLTAIDDFGFTADMPLAAE